MPIYSSNPSKVQAFKHTDPRGLIPEPFASLTALTAASGTIKIGKDPVGQLLVPAGGSIKTARIGDYVVLRENGDLDVVRGAEFEAGYTLDEAEAEAPVAEGSAVEPQA